MTEKRFLLGASHYDLRYEFRVADLTRVEKTKEDFWNEEKEEYEYLEYLNYLYMNGAFLTEEEVDKIFNGLHEENQELLHKLSQQEMEYATTAHRQAEENEELRIKNNAYTQDIEVYKEENTCLKLENDQLESENERLTNKLNEIALDFVNHYLVSMGKAVEISEMSYSDFLKFRKERGKPMELQE